MKHLTALVIKYIMVAAVLEVVLGIWTNLSIIQILLVALAVTILAYVIGDLAILVASNNIFATIADIGLTVFIIYMFNYMYRNRTISFTSALAAAVVVGIGEWFFHKYMGKNVLSETEES